MNERWEKIERLYHAARELDQDLQARFLDEACRSDLEMRRQIDDLLKQDREQSSFLDTPAVEFAAQLTSGSSLPPRTRLGPYEIVQPIGTGGMGKVYKARDTRLNRTVAIKVVQQQFGVRFEREARAISSLNHPHVCTLYDIGPNYLVMELVEGETFAARLEKGKLPVELVLQYGAEIADALAAAHAKGIIHRDLKPGNVMITKSGVKVLDFGLAKAPEDETLTSSLAGMGTPAYMPPEQREGKSCDARTDLYALGLLLAEAATGKRLLPDGAADLAELPEKAAHVIGRCLELDPEDRWQSAIDLKQELTWAASIGSTSVSPRTRQSMRWIAGISIVSLILFGAFTWLLINKQSRTTDARPLSLTLNAPQGAEIREGSAISPDGRSVVFVAHASGADRLFIRPLDSLNARDLAGTEAATYPFWSPDSRFIGFFAEGKLKRIDVTSGLPTVICNIGAGRGGTWNEEGIILFNSVNDGPLLRVPAAGGTPVPITTVDTAHEENSHRFPYFLPGGRQFLYYVRSANPEVQGIYLGSLDRPQEKIHLVKSATAGIFAPARNGQPPNMVWVADGTLMIQPLDVAHARLTSEPAAFAEHIRFSATARNAEVSASNDGTLVYGSDATPSQQLTWFGRDGKAVEVVGRPDSYAGVIGMRISPDGSRVALSQSPIGIAVLELSRGIPTPAANGFWGAWSPDARHISYTWSVSGPPNIYTAAATSGGETERLTESHDSQMTLDWSADGRFILYMEGSNDISATDQSGLYVLPLEGARKPVRLLDGRNGGRAQFSPDVHWIAYTSSETGRREVYVQSFPAGPAKWKISEKGGDYPRWSREGKELFYLGSDQMLTSVPVDPVANSLEFRRSDALFKLSGLQEGNPANYPYDIGPGAQRILAFAPASNAQSQNLTVISNWQAALRRTSK